MGSKRERKLNHAKPGELYRATCDVCDWTGNWHSVWNKWETLLAEVEEEWLEHMLVNHGNNHATATNE